MNFLSLVAGISAPHDLWTILIDWIQGGIGNFGWTLLILTILVKAVTIPLDIVVKYTTKKQTLVQQKCAPQIAKLQKKFGNDKQRLQVQTQALYKHEGLKMGTGCIVMLINMILTMAIFFSFYGTLRDVSAYQAINQYEQISEVSNNTMYQSMIDYKDNDNLVDRESVDAWLADYNESKAFIDNTENDPTTQEYLSHKSFVDSYEDMINVARENSQKAIHDKWEEIKDSWLWVDNIWVADATTAPFPTYDNLLSIAESGGSEYVEYVEQNISREDYSSISGVIYTKDTKHNGYYILAIMAGVITYLSQLVTSRHNKLKNKNADKLAKSTNSQTNQTMKIMKIVMPILMITFVLSASASFGIYILASNICSIVFGELVKLIVDKLTKKQQLEVEEELAKEAERLIRKGKLQG